MPNEPDIDWGLIEQWEGVRRRVYVPVDSDGNVVGKSGPTIGTGVDLGAWREGELRAIDVSDGLIEKLRPYLGMKGQSAVSYVEEHPLEISEAEQVELDRAVQRQFFARLIEKYDRALDDIEFAWPVDKAKRFTELPREIQTTLYSVAHQYGLNLDRRAPRFWKFATQQRWVNLVKELKDFRDQTPGRRNQEAALIERLISECEGPMQILKREGSAVVPGAYTGQTVNGQPCGDGNLVYADPGRGEKVYSGEFAQAMPFGTGTIEYVNGDRFEGFVLGHRSGEGTYLKANGDKFVGHNPNDYWGPATILFADGRIYEGETAAGLFHGSGRMTYPDGRVEEGRWAANGVRYPEPVRREEESFDTYEGPFIVGHILGGDEHGYVKYTPASEPVYAEITWRDGATYEGGWSSANKAHGRGRSHDPDGTSYTGDFVNGKAHGRGVLTRAGDRYEGDFAAGNFHGQGSWERAQGPARYVGRFQEGRFEEGTASWTATGRNERFAGEYKRGLPNGKGELYGPWGQYVGEFADGKFSGSGSYEGAGGGMRYEGTWRDGTFVHGRITWPDGTRYEGALGPDGSFAGGRYFDSRGVERNLERHGPVDREWSRPDADADDEGGEFCIKNGDRAWECGPGGSVIER